MNRRIRLIAIIVFGVIGVFALYAHVSALRTHEALVTSVFPNGDLKVPEEVFHQRIISSQDSSNLIEALSNTVHNLNLPEPVRAAAAEQLFLHWKEGSRQQRLNIGIRSEPYDDEQLGERRFDLSISLPCTERFARSIAWAVMLI